MLLAGDEILSAQKLIVIPYREAESMLEKHINILQTLGSAIVYFRVRAW